MPMQNAEVVRTWRDRLAVGDVAAAMRVARPDVRIVVPAPLPYGGTYTGSAEVTQLFARLRDAWDDWQETPSPAPLAAVGDRVFHEVRVRARTRRGATVETWLTEVVVVTDGSIAEVRVFYGDPLATARGLRGDGPEGDRPRP